MFRIDLIASLSLTGCPKMFLDYIQSYNTLKPIHTLLKLLQNIKDFTSFVYSNAAPSKSMYYAAAKIGHDKRDRGTSQFGYVITSMSGNSR